MLILIQLARGSNHNPFTHGAGTQPPELSGRDEKRKTIRVALDESFFRVRFDRLTQAKKSYLRTMPELVPGPHRFGDIAQILTQEVSALGPIRSNLIRKGMVWSLNNGDTAFTVPLFDEFMKRILPGPTWLDV